MDRDGTMIVDVPYSGDPERVRLVPGAAAAMRRLQLAGYALVLISNQSGIARKIFDPSDLERVHGRLVGLLRDQGVTLTNAYYCPHAPSDGCACRKPSPGMILRAAEELGIDLAASVVIGDSPSDVAAGKAAGCRTILLTPSAGEAPALGEEPDLRARGWDDAARWVLRGPRPT